MFIVLISVLATCKWLSALCCLLNLIWFDMIWRYPENGSTVHNVLHCRQVRTEPQTQVTRTDKLVMYWADWQTDRQTDRQTDKHANHNTSYPTGGEVTILFIIIGIGSWAGCLYCTCTTGNNLTAGGMPSMKQTSVAQRYKETDALLCTSPKKRGPIDCVKYVTSISTLR